MMNHIKDVRQFKKDMLFLAGLVLGFFFLLWKSKYGTGAHDEPFYLTMPHRILKGDGMFSEEWNFGQFSAFLMLPVMKLYLLIKGTTEEIVLGFRYIYIVFQVICTIVVYMNLRKKESGWIAAWIFCLFCPYDIMALSYNTMGMAFMTIVGVMLSKEDKNNGKSWFAVGILFAAAVLCNPFLAVLYFLYTLLVMGMRWKQKRLDHGNENGEKSREGNVSLKAWAYITTGVLLLAAVFMITVLSGSTIQDLLKNIPLLMQDPEHTSRSVFAVIKVYLFSFWKVYRWFLPVWAVLLFMACLCRKDSRKRRICFALAAFSSILCMLGFLPTIQNSYHFIMVPITACGAASYIMTEDKDRGSFWYLFVFGIAYSFMANYASNQGMHAISMAMIPTVVAAVLFIGEFMAQEMRTEKKLQKNVIMVSAVLLFTVQIGMQVYTKAVHAFWEEPVWKLQTVIEEGPLKGTVTTSQKAERYASVLADIKTHIRKEGPVLFVTEDTWCYLYADTEYGTFSAYLSGGLNQAQEKWKLYFEAHPEKIPDYICFPVAEISFDWSAVVRKAAEEYGYEVELSKESYHLYKK